MQTSGIHRPPLFYLQVMQRGQGHDFILFRRMGIWSVPESSVPLCTQMNLYRVLSRCNDARFMVTGSHGYVAIQAGVQLDNP